MQLRPRNLTADVASALMSRKAVGSAGQNRLNITGSAVGSAEWGSKPAIDNSDMQMS